VIQGWLLRVQKCAVGRTQVVSSSVPHRTLRLPSGLGALQMQEPHSGQTNRVVMRPLSAVRWIARGAIPKKRKAESVTMIAIEKALPVKRFNRHNGMCKPTVELRRSRNEFAALAATGLWKFHGNSPHKFDAPHNDLCPSACAKNRYQHENIRGP
jgi:hypothetical protein